MAKKQEDNEPQHRGRIQAQGGNLEESEAWWQDKPLTLEEGLILLEKLKDKLPIEQAGENGGINAQVSKTFRVKGNAIKLRVFMSLVGHKQR